MKVDVQAMVERPETYILARCPADSSQLMYSNLRFDDMTQVETTPLEVDGIQLHDKIRFFKGIPNKTQSISTTSLKCK